VFGGESQISAAEPLPWPTRALSVLCRRDTRCPATDPTSCQWEAC